ncbi:MAG: endonuclease/exonuclease/phosphatase family protein [Bacteroidota bacterium]
MKFLKKIIVSLNIALVIALLLAYLSPYVDPNESWVFSIFGLVYPVLLIANLVMVVAWLFIDYKYLFLSLVAILVGLSHIKGFVNVNSTNAAPSDLKILAYNLAFSYSLRSGTKEARAKNKNDLKTFFGSQNDIDIFCLQESSSFSRNILKEIYPDYYNHEVERRGTFIFSRYPIIRHGEISFGTSTNSCLWADIQFQNETIRIYNMHLQSNQVSKDAVKIIDNGNLQEKKTWVGIRGILNKYRSASRVRAHQSKKVADHAAKSLHPTVICGDVNDPPTSFIYNRICGDYQDSFIEAGKGIGTTYAGKIPMLRIDYIFVDEQFEVNSFDILTEKFSDHYAVKGGYRIR